jgi:predicted metallopeptidase
MSDTYFLAGDQESYDVTKQVIAGFDRFKHINPDEILIIYKCSEKSRDAANVRKFPKLYSVLAPGKKILLVIWRPNWESTNLPKKIALIYHELIHIGFDEKKTDYKMVRHDVEDFKELISRLGFNYENAAELIKEMKSEVKPKINPEDL